MFTTPLFKTDLSGKFRVLLQNELLKRCEKNPRYSLRAFAKAMDLDASTLSQILRGKRQIGKRTQAGVLKKLSLDGDQLTEIYHASVDAKYRNLTADAFTMIADWYHFAITQLMRLKSFKQDESWIAKRLGITKSEVNIAIERLQRLGVIEVSPAGLWILREEAVTTTGNPFTAPAFRKMQKQILAKAADAMDEVPIELRDQTSMAFPVNPARMPEAKELLKKFRREFCAIMEADADASEVYQLGISFYPLTKSKESV